MMTNSPDAPNKGQLNTNLDQDQQRLATTIGDVKNAELVMAGYAYKGSVANNLTVIVREHASITAVGGIVASDANRHPVGYEQLSPEAQKLIGKTVTHNQEEMATTISAICQVTEKNIAEKAAEPIKQKQGFFPKLIEGAFGS